MAKHRKTRDEKIAASIKHFQKKQEQQMTYSLPSADYLNPVSSSNPIVKTTFTYQKDILRTFFISFLLLLFEIVLYYLLHFRFLKIPWTSY